MCVDLDGTLIASDTLYEGLIGLLRRNPLFVFALPVWLMRGKAVLKAQIAARSPIDATALPYNPGLLALLGDMRGSRPIILCTAAHTDYARAVAKHLGFFDRVMATEDVNFGAHRKAEALVAQYGERGFDYAGDQSSDLTVFAVARQAFAVNASLRLRRRFPEIKNLARVIDTHPARRLTTLLKAIRVHQWIKNTLVFVALLASHRVTDVDAVVRVVAAFVAYGLCASGVYLLNDLIDLKADRTHPRKKHRPLASGALSIRSALIFMPILFTSAFVLAIAISPLFAALLLTYCVVTNLYAFWLKRVPILDTIILAGLYTLRILAGAAAIPVVPSFWLLAFSMFFFFSLALAKRHSELLELEDMNNSSAGVRRAGETAIPGRGYSPEDQSTIVAQGAAAGQAAVLVLALYINTDQVRAQFKHPEVLWAICPLMVYWITKLWLNAQRRQIKDDPVVWAVKNRVSRAIGVLCLILFAIAIL
jgi:4-hydroxybenzoate polyprenyltransferase/phosphoserine phosphatase